MQISLLLSIIAQKLRFYFFGVGATNYGNELLHQTLDLWHRFTPEMKDALLDNYLVNPSGKPGAFHARDLLQEHLNFKLKAIFNNRTHAFDSSFLKEAVSLNIVQLNDLQKGWPAQLGLTEIRPGRPETDLCADINHLGRAYLVGSLHIYDSSRTQSYLSHDAFAAGGEKLKCGALQSFVDQHGSN